MGGDSEGRAEEEDVISQKATTVHGWQGSQGHHSAQHMLGMWKGQAHAPPVPLLR